MKDYVQCVMAIAISRVQLSVYYSTTAWIDYRWALSESE
jgi:hypothetical protein